MRKQLLQLVNFDRCPLVSTQKYSKQHDHVGFLMNHQTKLIGTICREFVNVVLMNLIPDGFTVLVDTERKITI